ncbi:hypothetical protein EV421DRAFT_1246407 [Armillaria borealis]|uniref:Secreted protein n=1 Tax=Armillaria borealis TaxID=47425 RepID=A0AA39J5Q7_9AGAR|nr:hypothetical protein EV421DRAFT_1246407 [Armillaria borealis]
MNRLFTWISRHLVFPTMLALFTRTLDIDCTISKEVEGIRSCMFNKQKAEICRDSFLPCCLCACLCHSTYFLFRGCDGCLQMSTSKLPSSLRLASELQVCQVKQQVSLGRRDVCPFLDQVLSTTRVAQRSSLSGKCDADQNRTSGVSPG